MKISLSLNIFPAFSDLSNPKDSTIKVSVLISERDITVIVLYIVYNSLIEYTIPSYWSNLI